MKSLDILTDKYNFIVGGIITILTTLFGKLWFLFAIFLFLNIVDYISGCLKARKLNTLSSKMGQKGICKKIWYWVVIIIAFMIAYCFKMLGSEYLNIDLSFLQCLGWYTLAQYMINELRSFVENLVEMDIKVPSIFTKGLAITEWILKRKEEEITINENEIE